MRNRYISDDPVHIYPETSIHMLPGDVLYSHKTALSSIVVGHAAIIGEDFRIYHVNRWPDYGHGDSMPIYLSRHKKGEKLTILRHPNREEARNAAKWAKQHKDQIISYHYTRDLRDIQKNYCSKFVWQAFYFGNEGKVDLIAMKGLTSFTRLRRYSMPAQIYWKLKRIGAFRNVLYVKRG
ncbi:hypothetical protein NSQ77_10245 [Oceanobacillus sp. FSL K6-2867]|uniref:hypothetical protein n=1 Tax=Oceanobacillus sp. FSL K6-2867 TaxID=2954748 RepID=UPI0030DAFC3C